MAAPPWLARALAFKAEDGDKMLEEYVLCHLEEGDWEVGVVRKQNKNSKVVAEVEEGGMAGEFPCNFKIQFADATVDHLLRLEDYASSVSDGAGTWCLVSEDRSRTRKSSKAPVTKVVAVQKMDIGLDDVKGMPKGKRKELLALLQQADGEDED